MKDASLSVQRAQAQDLPGEIIADELERRGHPDLARFLRGRLAGRLEMDDEEGVIAAFLGPLPFEVGADGE
jgi:hypothetical protein